jgi:regulator of replication initiation timing
MARYTTSRIAMSPSQRHDEVVARILAGTQQTVSFPGRSQYAAGGGGASACGLAAFNCVRIILSRERDGIRAAELVSSMVDRETIEVSKRRHVLLLRTEHRTFPEQEILDVCLRWSGADHLDVEDIYEAPIFKTTLIHERTVFKSPGVEQFRDLLSYVLSDLRREATVLTSHSRQLLEVSSHGSAAIITRPPEIVAVLKLPCSTNSDIFVVFDSHPREAHPHGAGFIFRTSADDTAQYLHELFKFDDSLLEDESLQWQAQLLANFSAHMFTIGDDATSQYDAVMDTSLAVLSMKAKIVQLATDNSTLKTENQQLQDQLDTLELQNNDLREDLRRLKKDTKGKEKAIVPVNGHISATGRCWTSQGVRYL